MLSVSLGSIPRQVRFSGIEYDASKKVFTLSDEVTLSVNRVFEGDVFLTPGTYINGPIQAKGNVTISENADVQFVRATGNVEIFGHAGRVLSDNGTVVVHKTGSVASVNEVHPDNRRAL